MDRLWLAQLISSWFYIFNKSHSLTPSKVWEKKGLGTIIRVFFSLCLSFISTSQNMEVCRRSDVELCWWLPRASNQQATLLPGRRFSWYGLRQSDIILFLDIFSYDIFSYDISSVYQISFCSLISFHLISFRLWQTDIFLFLDIFSYHIISYDSNSVDQISFRTAKICYWKVSPCVAHQHPPWCHQNHNIFTSVTIATILPKDPTVLGVKLIRSRREWLYQRRPGHHQHHNVAQCGTQCGTIWPPPPPPHPP